MCLISARFNGRWTSRARRNIAESPPPNQIKAVSDAKDEEFTPKPVSGALRMLAEIASAVGVTPRCSRRSTLFIRTLRDRVALPMDVKVHG